MCHIYLEPGAGRSSELEASSRFLTKISISQRLLTRSGRVADFIELVASSGGREGERRRKGGREGGRG